MDQIFPRFRDTSPKKLGNIFNSSAAPIWVFLIQICALGILAIAPLLIGRSLTQVGTLVNQSFFPSTNFQPLLNLVVSPEQLVLTAVIAYPIAWMYLGCSLWVYHYRREQPYTSSLAIVLSAGAICLVVISVFYISQYIVWLWVMSLALFSVMLITFGLRFPNDNKRFNKHFYKFLIGYGTTIAFFSSIAMIELVGVGNTNSSLIGIITTAYLIFNVTIVSILLWGNYSGSGRNAEKAQIRLVILGIVLSFSPILIWAVLNFRIPNLYFSPYLLILLAIFPLSTSYAVTHYIKNIEDRSLSRKITYSFISGLVVIFFTLFIAVINFIVITLVPRINPFLMILLVFVLVLAINPLRNWVQSRVDSLFFKGKHNYQEILQFFARDLAQVADIPSTVTILNQYIKRIFTPDIIHSYTYDSHRAQFCAMPGVDGQPTSDVCFPINSSLVRALSDTDHPIYVRNNEFPREFQLTDIARTSLLGAVLFVAFPGQKQLTGWLALGPRQSGNPYLQQEIALIDSLCRQVALAIERFQVITHLEHRIRELDVLTRIAQGVNITLEFDDILELIFAQTINVIPTIDFRITLRSPMENRCFHAFFVDADERLAYNENVNIPQEHGLESIVIQNQRAFIAEDYLKECNLHGAIPDTNGIIAWMGVPMNAGGTTIGAISVASRDPAMVFTQSHLDILQAIADQAAGAIIKSQLLAEAEKRTRQLNKLNTIARSLTSTLEINPLLKQIMMSAVEILNCEAGSLVMVDEQTGELVFEVTVGPVASDISGVRLPPGTGVAGKVIQNGEPLIANNASQNQDWFAQSDKETGFFTRDLLAVPMNVKGTIIGVIEVINKLDGTAFTIDDQEFLSTFTSQAAIAIENARLYTQTDKALSARVEEMSVMQRIDRDLNTTLDVERTLKITLDWSLNQTRAEAGLIGFVENQETDGTRILRVVATKGYPTESTSQTPENNRESGNQFQVSEHKGVNIPTIVNIPVIQQVIREGQPIRNEFYLEPQILEETNYQDRINLFHPEENLLPTARSQVIIPIRRKTDVIAILLLESTRIDNFPEETVTFLSRLSDHAAIAISNALLYADLQAANIAKSEFVSLVSHELKTPMTSIRGYADLLAQGTVGPINEIQSNFLNTIRSNVNRMSNLVSDLADVSRIEAGRLRLDFGSVSAPTIVEEVVRSAQAQLNEKEQVLNLAIPEYLPNIWGDYNRLIQIMNNLVSNAIKYTPERGQINISADLSNNINNIAAQVLHLSVSDTGYGISKEDQDKIFSKFFRSGDPNIREVPGTGLGLNITRHLVEMQGGQIWFESAVGKGTTFHFTIPVSATDHLPE